MADNGDVVVDWGLNVDPAIAAAKKLEAVLDGIHAKLANTSGLVAAQVKSTVDEYNKLIATIDQSKPGGRMQALALESRKQTDASRRVKAYEDYGTAGPIADAMRDQMSGFRRELNANRQTAERLFSTLAKDLIQGQIDAIRTQVNVAKARILDETFQASALLRRTSPEALQARAVLDQERVSRSIRNSDARLVEYREIRDRRRDERALNPTLQAATAARSARADARLISSESPEGQQRAASDVARKEAEGLNRYLDGLAAANRRSAEEENKRHDQASRALRQEAEDVNKRRDQAERSIRQQAESENQRREQASRALRRQAEFDNQQHSAASRQLRLEAEDENKRRDQAQRAYDRLYAEAERENRLRDRTSQIASRRRETQKLSDIRNAPDLEEIRLRRAQRSADNERERDRVGDAAFANKQILERTSDPSFLGVQANLLGNYFALTTIFNTIKGLGSFITDFDEQLHQLKAISEATTTEMENLSKTFISVASSSKFSAVDIAKAATTMAQAGLSANEIEKSIGSVVKLATATGSSLDASVDLVTSVLGAFNLQGGETEKIADVVTEALNRTKLTVDKLALGFQYSANIAADAGISYTELTAILGQLAQTGIRSGSTLGTGLRQLLVDLSKPSEKFREIIGSLGLTMADVDVKTNGFLGVLTNLKNAGFTAADAIQSFEVRAASSYTALSNNVEAVAELNASFATTKAATAAAETQMESFNATYQNLLNRISAATYQGFSPIVVVLQNVLAGSGQAFSYLSQYPTVLQTIGATLSSVIGITAISYFVKLATAIKIAVVELRGMQIAMAALSLGGLIPGWAGLAVAVGATALGFTLFNNTTESTADRMEKLKTASNAIKGALDTTVQSIRQVDDTIRNLSTQGATLDANPILRSAKIAEVKGQFAELGLQIDGSTNSIAALVKRLEELSQKLSGKAVLQYTEQLSNLTRQQKELNLEIERQKGSGLNLKNNPGYTDAPGRLDTAVKGAASFLGTPVAVPNTASDYEAIRARLVVERNNLEQERFRLKNLETPTSQDERSIFNIERKLQPLDEVVKTFTIIGEKLQKYEQNEQERKTLEAAREAQRFRETDAGQAIGRAAQDLTKFSVQAPRTFAQSTDDATAFSDIRDRQKQLLDAQKETVENARDFLVGQGKTLDEANRIIAQSGLEQTGTEAQEAVRNAVSKIDESMNGLLKKRADQISDRIGEISKSVNINSSIEKIDGAIGEVTKGLASKFDVIAQQTKGFDYTAGTDKGEVIRRAIELAKAENVDPAAILAIIQKESSFRRDAQPPINPETGRRASDAYGLFQFIPGTGKQYGFKPGDDLDTELKAGIALFKANQEAVSKTLGRDANPFEAYLAHMLGSGGAAKALKGDVAGSAVDQLGVGASNNGSSGKRADETLGQFLARHKADFEKAYGGSLVVRDKVDGDSAKLTDLRTLRDKAVAKRESDALEAESKRQLQELDVLGSEARRAKTPEAIDGLLAQANKLVPDLIENQVEALKKSPEFKDRLDEADAQKEIADREDKLRIAAQEKINKIIDAKYEAAIKKANEPVENAKTRLDTLKSNLNAGNALPSEVKSAENGLEEAERVRDLKVEEIQAQKTAEANETLNKARLSGNQDQVVAANERVTDSLEKQAVAARNATISNQRVAPLTYGAATQKGTYNFLNSQGAIDESGSIKSGAQQWGESWTQVLSGVQSGFEQLSLSLVNDPKNWKTAIQSFGLSFIQMFEQMIVKALFLQIIMSMFGSGGATPAGGGAASPGIFASLGTSLGFAGGGEVKGGTPNRDSVVAKLMPGEVIMKKAAVQAVGKDNLLALNQMGSNISQMSQPKSMADQPRQEGAPVNVWVVAPDEKPSMGPKDVIAVIADDMKRKGATRQLVRQIQQGNA